MDTVSPGPRSDGKQNVADSLGSSSDQVLLAKQPHAHCVDQRVSAVTGREAHLAAEGGYPHAVAIVSYAANDTRKEIAVTPLFKRSEPKAVEKSHRPSTHGEDIS